MWNNSASVFRKLPVTYILHSIFYPYPLGRCLGDAKLQLAMGIIAELLMALPVAILHFSTLYTLSHTLLLFFILYFIRYNFCIFALLQIIPSQQLEIVTIAPALVCD